MSRSDLYARIAVGGRCLTLAISIAVTRLVTSAPKFRILAEAGMNSNCWAQQAKTRLRELPTPKQRQFGKSLTGNEAEADLQGNCAIVVLMMAIFSSGELPPIHTGHFYLETDIATYEQVKAAAGKVCDECIEG